MTTQTIEFIPAKRRVHRKRQGTPTPPAPPVVVAHVLSVTRNGGNLRWTFDRAVTMTTTPVELEANIGSGMEPPVSGNDSGPDWIELGYSQEPASSGYWQVQSAPTGLTFADGATLAVPEEGSYS